MMWHAVIWERTVPERQLQYEEVLPINRRDAEATLASGSADAIVHALLRSAYHDPDWRWVQEQCIRLSRHADPDVRGIAVLCLGHLARIHRRLDVDRALPVVHAGLADADPTVAGHAEDALDDLAMFLGIPAQTDNEQD
jgi:hypothetical protein